MSSLKEAQDQIRKREKEHVRKKKEEEKKTNKFVDSVQAYNDTFTQKDETIKPNFEKHNKNKLFGIAKLDKERQLVKKQIKKLENENNLSETSFNIKIVGINHSNYPYPLSSIWQLYLNNHRIILEHDTKNIYDKFAVKCLIGNKRFGYIQRSDSAENPVSKNIKSLLDNYFAYKVYIESDFANFTDNEKVFEIRNVRINFYTENNWSKIKIPKPTKTIQNIIKNLYSQKITSTNEYNLNLEKNIQSEIKKDNYKVNYNHNTPRSRHVPRQEGMGFLYWFLFWDSIFVGLLGLVSVHKTPGVSFYIMITCFGIAFLMYMFASRRK